MTQFSNPAVTTFLQSGEFSEINGNSIFCYGAKSNSSTAPTVLLIHGFPTSSWDWKGVEPLLLESLNIECLDMLGFGFSDKPDRRNYTIHKQADLHEQRLLQLNVSEAHIVAHDYGVSVAQELLARQHEGKSPIKYQSCTFLNGGLFPETHHALLIQKLLLSPLGPFLNRFLAFNKFKQSFSKVFGEHTKPSADELRDFWEIINYKNGKHLFHNLITYMSDRKFHRERWLAALQQSRIPLALINGSQDPVSGAHLVDRYKELGCRLDSLEVLPSIGHYPQVEAPNEVAHAITTFVLSH